jgi:hypothetical protein
MTYFGQKLAQLGTNRRVYSCLHYPQGSDAMRDYRAYILGIDGHRYIRVEEFLHDHSDDAAAVNAAKQLSDKHDVEVWDCGRLVARLSPDGEAMSPELAPSLVSGSPADSDKNSFEPSESVRLSKVSELAMVARLKNPQAG